MFDLHITVGMIKAGLTLIILVAAVYSFISEKISPDVTALLAILALLLTGILTPGEAFSGFSHPATVAVAAVLVLSAAIEHTGVLTIVARRLLAPLGRSELLLTVVIMVLIGAISAFINNTAAVAIFIPVLFMGGILGRPVVASDVPGNNDLIRHKETGLLYVSEDDMAKQVLALYRNRSAAGALGVRIREDFQRRYDEHTEMTALLSAYAAA